MQITITQWKDEYADAFRTLSLEWLTKYVEVEPRDVETFEHPHETVLDPGGMIWFALADGVPVGTIGLSPEEDGEWELIKLAVTQDFQGYGIGRQLIETVIQRAKEMHLKSSSCSPTANCRRPFICTSGTGLCAWHCAAPST